MPVLLMLLALAAALSNTYNTSKCNDALFYGQYCCLYNHLLCCPVLLPQILPALPVLLFPPLAVLLAIRFPACTAFHTVVGTVVSTACSTFACNAACTPVSNPTLHFLLLPTPLSLLPHRLLSLLLCMLLLQFLLLFLLAYLCLESYQVLFPSPLAI